MRIGAREFRPTLWATVAATAVLAVLIGLGVWQLQRLEWKQGIIAGREARMSAPEIDLPARTDDPEALAYHRARVTGRFLHDREMHLIGRSHQGATGVLVVTPLVRDDGQDLLVVRGWVPITRRDPATRPEGQLAGEVAVTGVLIPGGWGGRTFAAPQNLPEENHWLYLDREGMAAHAGLDDPFPLFLEASPSDQSAAIPIPRPARVNIRNDHLQYAITWFSLALGLVVIYLLFHLKKPDETP